jgi:ABC-2 type transport system permease protein
MNIYLHEIKQYRKSAMIWTLSMIAVQLMFLSLFREFMADSEAFMKVFEGLPKEVLSGFAIDLKNLLSFNGYYGYIMTFILLFMSIMGMNLGLSLFSRENTDKTADFLMTKPVKRETVVAAKLLAGITLIVIANAILIAEVFFIAGVLINVEFDKGVCLLLGLSVLITELLFFAMGSLWAVFAKRIRSVVTVSVSIVMTFFIGSTISRIIEEDKVRILLPFRYFESIYILRESSYETVFLLTSIAAATVFIGLSFLVFKRKDIHAV